MLPAVLSGMLISSKPGFGCARPRVVVPFDEQALEIFIQEPAISVLKNVMDQFQEGLHGEWFLNEVHSFFECPVLPDPFRSVTGHEEGFQLRDFFAQFLVHVHTVHSRQDNIADKQLKRQLPVPDHGKGCFRILCSENPVSLIFKKPRDQLKDIGFILNNQNG